MADSDESQEITNKYAGQVITEIDLPFGYEDKEGKFHKHVVMRRVKNRDIVVLKKDQRLKEIANENLGLSGGNPVKGMFYSGATIQMFSVLFTQVVMQIGEIEKPGYDIFENLYQKDMELLIRAYNELNENDSGEGEKRPPLEQILALMK